MSIPFTFQETHPDMSTFPSRVAHFLQVSDPRNFFVEDEEILKYIALVKKFKAQAKESKDGVIHVSQQEKADIYRGIQLMNSSTNDVGDLVWKPARLCGFVPLNVPIIAGMMLAPPTMGFTVFFQWLN